jgi:hypothetical protein
VSAEAQPKRSPIENQSALLADIGFSRHLYQKPSDALCVEGFFGF